MQHRSTLLALALLFVAFSAQSQTPAQVPPADAHAPLANKIGGRNWRDMDYPPGSIWRHDYGRSAAAAPKALRHTEWTLISATDIHGKDLPQFFKPLDLFLGHSVLFTRGCNNFAANTSEEEGRLKLSGGQTTLMACAGSGGLKLDQRDRAIQAHLSDRPHVSLRLWGSFEPRLYLTRDNGDTLEFALVGAKKP